MWNVSSRTYATGLRSLANAPGFTFIAVLTLSLGIGATTAIFSVIDAVVLKPLPFKGSEQSAVVWGFDKETGEGRYSFSYPDYKDLLEQNRSFHTLAAWTTAQPSLTSQDADPVRLKVTVVSHRLFALLGISPLVGRSFVSEEDEAGAEAVAVLEPWLLAKPIRRRPCCFGIEVEPRWEAPHDRWCNAGGLSGRNVERKSSAAHGHPSLGAA